MREILNLILRALAAGVPLPDWQSLVSVAEWLHRIEGVEAELIVLIANAAAGPVKVEALPDDELQVMAAEAGISFGTIMAIVQTVMAVVEMWRKLRP